MRWHRAGLLAVGLTSAVAVLAGCSGAGHADGSPGAAQTAPQDSAAPQPSPTGGGAPAPGGSGVVASGSTRPAPGSHSTSALPTGTTGRGAGKTVKPVCQQISTDMVAVVLGPKPGPAAATSTPVFAPTPSAVLVCVYSVQGNELVHGTEVTGSAEATLLAGLKAGSASCPANRAEYAVVQTAAGVGQVAWVDLDDCARVLRPDNTVGQASPAALKIIDAVASGH